MNSSILTYLIQNDLKQLKIEDFQIEEITAVNPKEIKVSKRELAYVHYVNIKDNRADIIFASDDNHHLYMNENLRQIDLNQFESSFIHKHLTNIKIESTCNFYVQYFKIRF